jgi:magnesium chelatase family protein
VRAADHLLEVCAHVAGTATLAAGGASAPPIGSPAAAGAGLDLADVCGQHHAKRALTIAAAGGHSLLMIGPTGCGKSMLAQRLPGLLPPLTDAEALEVAAIASVSSAGFSQESLTERPFRAPHHTSSAAALVGGGARARPGEISLAHHGVLFLDELPEFERAVLEALREPLENGVVSVARAALTTQYPAQFQLVAAMNPCPCGRLGDPAGGCRCTPAMVLRYRARVSGPLLDRLDLQLEMQQVEAAEFDEPLQEESGSAVAAAAVARARELQRARQGVCNARLTEALVHRWCAPDEPGRRRLETAMRRLRLSGRARARVLKIARTIADLDGRSAVGEGEVTEAVGLRCLDRAAP